MNKLLSRLRGGDRRSIGNSSQIARLVSRTPTLLPQLFEGLVDGNPLIRMRAADAIEKATRLNPGLLQPWKQTLLKKISGSQQTQVRWHLAQMLPRLNLSATEQKTAVRILTGYLADESSLVRTMSMQALFDLSMRDGQLRPRVEPMLSQLTRTGTAAMRSRGRRLLRMLHEST